MERKKILIRWKNNNKAQQENSIDSNPKLISLEYEIFNGNLRTEPYSNFFFNELMMNY